MEQEKRRPLILQMHKGRVCVKEIKGKRKQEMKEEVGREVEEKRFFF
jgi:hypothetical protein